MSRLPCGFPPVLTRKNILRTGGHGSSGLPAFPAPSSQGEGEDDEQSSGETIRENAKVRLLLKVECRRGRKVQSIHPQPRATAKPLSLGPISAAPSDRLAGIRFCCC